MDGTLSDITNQDEFPLLSGKIKDKLDKMHELGIVHRDLSIDNIMYKGTDIYIIDFGASFLVNPGDNNEDLYAEDVMNGNMQIDFYLDGNPSGLNVILCDHLHE